MIKRKTTDALRIMDQRFYAGNPRRIEEREETARELSLGRKIRRLREAAGLSQQELADRIGTGSSAISRIEDADYDSHSMETLRRVAKALDMRLIITFEPAGRAARQM